MKILLVHNKYCLLGGEDSVFLTEKALLEELGYSVITYERSNDEFIKYGKFRKLKFLLNDFFWSRQTYKDIDKLCKKEKPDVAHFHNTYFMVSPSAYKACHDNGIKVVKTLHNYRLICPNALFYTHGDICEKCIKGNYLSALLKKCWRNSFSQTLLSVLFIIYCRIFRLYDKNINCFIALSQFSKSRFLKAKLFHDRIVVKPNFILTKNTQRTEVGNYILYIGALSDYKGVEDVVYAASKSRNIAFKIVGSGPLEEKIRKKVKQYGLVNLELLGQLSNKEVLDLIYKSLFVLLPSKCYENFPRVLVESYACGVPVLAARTPVFEELVLDPDQWTYESKDDMVKKINKHSFDKECLLTFANKVHSHYMSKYSIDKQKQYFERVYSSLTT